MKSPRFSIIINNYNYADYLSECIESALAQNYENYEVIIVDDGSKDNSREIIKSYGNVLIPIFKKNGGQGSAFNAGWEVASGELILFLDADDVIYENCLSTVAKYYNPKYVKYHYRLDNVNSYGAKLGSTTPQRKYNLASGNILETYLHYSFYVTSPTSGNIYSKGELDNFFPIDEVSFRICTDTIVNSLIVFYGEICSIDVSLGFYRLHNASNFSGKEKNWLRDINLNIKRQDAIAKEARKNTVIAVGDSCFRTGGNRLLHYWAKNNEMALPDYLDSKSKKEVIFLGIGDIFRQKEFSLIRRLYELFLFYRGIRKIDKKCKKRG